VTVLMGSKTDILHFTATRPSAIVSNVIRSATHKLHSGPFRARLCKHIFGFVLFAVQTSVYVDSL
jgi:hypothetical protein